MAPGGPHLEDPSAWHGGLMAGLRVWAGQSGVLAPWGCDCDCSPRAPWAPNLHLRRGR